MSATAKPPPVGLTDSERLTVRFTPNPDGWVTAQIVEFPAAISEGPTAHEAWGTVVEARHALTHEPTATERVVSLVQAEFARMVDRAEGVVGSLNDVVNDFFASRGRDRVH